MDIDPFLGVPVKVHLSTKPSSSSSTKSIKQRHEVQHSRRMCAPPSHTVEYEGFIKSQLGKAKSDTSDQSTSGGCVRPLSYLTVSASLHFFHLMLIRSSI